jgi:hypothetical protein
MSDPPRHPRPDPCLYRYELRIRTRVAPALAASFGCLAERAVVPRPPVRRLAVFRDGDETVDLPALVQRLLECDVAVLDARLCRPPFPAPENRAGEGSAP